MWNVEIIAEGMVHEVENTKVIGLGSMPFA
jgi:hypothetical protein